jgi:hypothetical protein
MLYGFLPYVQPIFATDAKLQDKFQFTHRPIKIKLKTTVFFNYRCEMNFSGSFFFVFGESMLLLER